jgi:hypothetical protein
MNAEPILHALGLDGAEPALRRAAERARQVAVQTGTPLVVWQDGKLALVAQPPTGAQIPEPERKR